MMRVRWRLRFALVVVLGLVQLALGVAVKAEDDDEGGGAGEVIKQIHSHRDAFVGREGKHFVLNGEAFYVNGWNSYWLMTQAVEEQTRSRVTSIFKHGAALGMTVCRTWAFNDAAYDALQMAPGAYSEKTFQVYNRKVELQLHIKTSYSLHSFECWSSVKLAQFQAPQISDLYHTQF